MTKTLVSMARWGLISLLALNIAAGCRQPHFREESRVKACPLIIAHRGLSGLYPENTLLAFREAVKWGVDGIETDVRRTRDGAIVCLHDETLDRTTNLSGKLSEYTLQEVRRADAGRGERIPTLWEALDEIDGKAMLCIEIKEVGIEAQVVDIVRRHPTMRHKCVIASFHAEAIKRAKKLAPEIPTQLIMSAYHPLEGEEALQAVLRAVEAGANSLSIHYNGVSRDLLREAELRGLAIWAWTVNEEGKMRELAEMGVRAIASDRADLAVKVLRPK